MRIEFVARAPYLVGGYLDGQGYQLGAPHEVDDPTYRPVGSGAQVALDGTEERDIDYIETTWRVTTDLIPIAEVPIWVMFLLSHSDGSQFVIDFDSDAVGQIFAPQNCLLTARQNIQPRRVDNAPLYRKFTFRIKIFS